jgi:hypothetical protein
MKTGIPWIVMNSQHEVHENWYTSFHGLRAVNSLLFMVYQFSWTSCCEFIIIHGIPVFMDFVLWIHYYSWYTSFHEWPTFAYINILNMRTKILCQGNEKNIHQKFAWLKVASVNISLCKFHGLRAVNSLLFMVYQFSWTSCCEFIIIHGIPVFIDFVDII